MPAQSNSLLAGHFLFSEIRPIQFSLQEVSEVTLQITNITGQLVMEHHLGTLPTGSHAYKWDAKMLPEGMYFIRIQTPGKTEVIKAIKR